MYLYFSVRMYIITALSRSDACLYWCLAYIREGISDLGIYVAVTSPYLWDQGVKGWYQSLGFHTFSTTNRQIKVILICNWNAWVLNIHSNHKCDVIYSFLAISSLNPETFLSFSLQLLPVISSTNSDMYPELIIFLMLHTLSYYHLWL